MDREQLIERARDYQDLSAAQYKRARRLRDTGACDWVVSVAQDYAAELAAEARIALSILVNELAPQGFPYIR